MLVRLLYPWSAGRRIRRRRCPFCGDPSVVEMTLAAGGSRRRLYPCSGHVKEAVGTLQRWAAR